MMTPEELQSIVAEVRCREAYEWEDLIVGIATGLTASKRVVDGSGPRGQGEQYKVLPVEDYRERLLRIAGLAVAAVEAYDAQVVAAHAVRAAAAPPPLTSEEVQDALGTSPEKPF